MTIQAQLFDGTILEFPDGTSPDVVNRVAKAQTQQRRGQMTHNAPAPEQPGYLKDMGMSALSGMARGALEMALMAGTTPGDVPIFSTEQTRGIQDAAHALMDQNLYEPKTTPGKFAGTVGEFMLPGGLPSEGARAAPTVIRKGAHYATELLGNALAPGVASEAAGQAVDAMGGGPDYEAAARILGAVGGNLGAAGVRSSVAFENVLRRGLEGTSPQQWDAMKALRDKAQARGVDVLLPELHSEVRNGASGLASIMRTIEGTLPGQAMLGPTFAKRPEQLKAATNAWLDTIAAQDAAPSTLGPRVAQAAEKAMNAGPEGQALQDAIFGVGPRVTDMQAGEVLQPALKGVYDRREGMRNALADQQYEAARRAPANIPVADLPALSTTTDPAYTSIEARTMGSPDPVMVPKEVPAKTEMPSLTSRTGPDKIQVDARPVVQFIDNALAEAKGSVKDALSRVRGFLYDHGGVGTSVTGADNVRGEIQREIAAAKQAGDEGAVIALERTRDQLDTTLQTVPEYKSAVDTFKAASPPLEPFTSPGMGSAIARDKFNTKFTTPAEDVPGALRTPSEAKAFNQVATPDASTAMENSLATKLMDQATGANGQINGDALARVLRDNGDLLSQFPAVADRLNTVVQASAKATAARVGPLAEVAGAADTTAAGNALLGPRAHVGSENEINDALTRLVMQDPLSTKGLVAQNWRDRFDKATTATQGGDASWAGGTFQQDMRGSDQRKATLDAALSAIGASPQDANDLMDVLGATGRRLRIGSSTESQRGVLADMGTRSVLGRAYVAARTFGRSLLTTGGDVLDRANLNSSLSTVADLFRQPDAIELAQQALARGARSQIPEALLRSALQAPGAAN